MIDEVEALRTERDELLRINEKYVEEILLLRAFAADEQCKRHEAEEKLMKARSEVEHLRRIIDKHWWIE